MAASKDINGLRKITIKAVCGAPDLEEIIKRKKFDLMDVYGKATRMKTVTSDFGTAVRFIGQFRAVNLATGEVFESTRLYLPGSMEEELSAAMDNGGSAEFGIRINVNYDKATTVHYYYDCINLVEPASNDVFALLENKMKEAVKALPAPKGGK